jgi:peptide-methionine (S)-S-oxide reductase
MYQTMKWTIALNLVLWIGLACNTAQTPNQKSTSSMTETQANATAPDGLELATLGGGCFWCVEAIYQDLKGVTKVASGYSGGSVENPTYNAVCSGTTGHAEVIQVTFDPSVVSYEEILEIFFTVHDPTTLNRQGNDIGTQYRSVIFYHSEAKKATAEKVIDSVKDLFENPIVTEVSPFTTFYVAEDYHQNYYKDNKYQPYCSYVITPKVKKFREKFQDKLKQ